MKKHFFAVSDIHGMSEHFESVLSHWNPEKEHLVLVGDYVDRGPHSFEVLQRILFLKENPLYEVTVLIGNHDLLFLDFLECPEETGSYYYPLGGSETINSFLLTLGLNYKDFTYSDAAKLIQTNFSSIIDLLKNQTCFFLETDNILFTHAGYQTLFSDFKNSTNNDFTNIRNHYFQKNETGLVNVFGHTPTYLINKDQSSDYWINIEKNFLAIDGGCCFGKQLNGILLNEQGVVVDSFVSK